MHIKLKHVDMPMKKQFSNRWVLSKSTGQREMEEVSSGNHISVWNVHLVIQQMLIRRPQVPGAALKL